MRLLGGNIRPWDVGRRGEVGGESLSWEWAGAMGEGGGREHCCLSNSAASEWCWFFTMRR